MFPKPRLRAVRWLRGLSALTLAATAGFFACGGPLFGAGSGGPGAQRGNDVTTGGSATAVVCPALGPWGAQAAQFEAEVLALVNAARARGARCGETAYGAQAPLQPLDALTCVARAYAQRMHDRGFFSHTGDDGSTVTDRIDAAGIEWRAVGENIAEGQTTPQDVVASWLDSPGHCTNIMGDFVRLGVGYVDGVWVQDFVAP